MKLSKARQGIIKNKLEIHLKELARKYNSEIDEFKRAWNLPDRREKINSRHMDHMQAIADFFLKVHIDAYEAENLVFDDEEKTEIVGILGALLNKKTYDCDLSLPQVHTLANDTERALSDILSNAELILRNARIQAELESKESNERRGIEILALEQEQKRHQVLKRIYHESQASPVKGVRYDAIRDKEQMTIEEVHGICTYLSQAGLTRHFRAQKCFITSEGIHKVEMELLPQDKAKNAQSLGERKVDFSFIADHRIRMIVERDYRELESLEPENETKSVLVLCGSIIEGLLLDATVTSAYWTYAEGSERFLKDMIYPAKTKGIIQHDNLSEVLRVFRNLIHPAREIRDSLVFDSSHAKHARAAVDVIINEVRKWFASRTP